MNNGDEIPSRSARKRESQSLHDIGERLVNLPADALADIPLPDELAAAVALARRIHERGGKRRQLQYIGKLMRGLESADLARIQHSLEALDKTHHDATEAEHRVAHWRDRLLKEGHAAVTALAAEHPHIDQERLATLTHEARAEIAAQKPPRAARALFRYLRDEVFHI